MFRCLVDASLVRFLCQTTLATLFVPPSHWHSLRHKAALRPVSTLQSATGILARKLVQKSLGMSAGAFNTREFFHGTSQLALGNVRWAICAGFLCWVCLCCL